MKTIHATLHALAAIAVAALSLAAAPAQAATGFQNTCSNIGFAYVNQQATLEATCLAANGMAQPTSLTLVGIGNNNGTLTATGGPSTFQQSCGNIQVIASSQGAALSALCRTVSGSSNATTYPLNNIGNNNGHLTY